MVKRVVLITSYNDLSSKVRRYQELICGHETCEGQAKSQPSAFCCDKAWASRRACIIKTIRWGTRGKTTCVRRGCGQAKSHKAQGLPRRSDRVRKSSINLTVKLKNQFARLEFDLNTVGEDPPSRRKVPLGTAVAACNNNQGYTGFSSSHIC